MICIGHLSGASGLHFNCHNMCTMWITNQVLLLRCWVTTDHVWYLVHASLFVGCVFFLVLCSYVSTGITARGVNYQQLNNVWTDLNLINSIVRHIHLVHTNASQGVNMDCIHSSRVNILIGRSTHVDSLIVLMASCSGIKSDSWC